MEIRSRFTQWRSKLAHNSGNPFQITWPLYVVFRVASSTEGLRLAEYAFFVAHFFFEVPAFLATAQELHEELDDEDRLMLELEESEASQAPELLSTSSSSGFEGSDPLCES